MTFDRLRKQENWIAWIRLCAVVWAVLEVAVVTQDYPDGYRTYAWLVTAFFGIAAIVVALLARRAKSTRELNAIGGGALLADTLTVLSYLAIYQFEEGVPVRGLVYLAVIEAAVRYGVRGGVALPIAIVPALLGAEWLRAEEFGPPEFDIRYVTLPVGISLITGLIVGGLVQQLWSQTAQAETRAGEAEELRDEIGRRADRLEAVNRCARALSSSLDLEEAFALFVREARTALAFDRLALVLAEGPKALVIANAGTAEGTLYPKGTARPIAGTVLEEILRDGRTIVRGNMDTDPAYPEERELAAAGLRSRVIAPLALGGRTLGMISVSAEKADAFSRDEVELLTLLGRQLAIAVENIRTFEAERTAAEELRRLSALRADFVSLVSHELRGPMASVVGCASTLRQRWRALNPEQRESFLALIEDETARLAGLVGDVLDTSRLEAGTFTYAFSDVDLGELVRDVAAVVDLGQEEVTVRADVPGPLPPVRADRERMRQLVMNLVGNAVKYTVSGDEVSVRAAADDGVVEVSVRDNGPGISREDQRVIFEKFGRATAGGGSKPGAGLGLFIARSIAEAHGGSLEVESEQGAGATFRVRLPVSAS